MTPEERARTIAYLDLAEGRGSVPLLDDDGVRALLASARRIAVIGASDRPGRASYDVFQHLRTVGFDCVPVNPRIADVAGVPTYPTLVEAVAATGAFDIVDVFRRPELCAEHAREAVAAGARCLWLQLGIVDWESARIAHDAGLDVVMDRCLSVESRRLGARRKEGA
ncbi:MAG TPA: CoA-binding protein [Candidatus Limnocylindrales bacterium]|nr:CoA-binding protein [Candidatus Limnocylindrales bacterium]